MIACIDPIYTIECNDILEQKKNRVSELKKYIYTNTALYRNIVEKRIVTERSSNYFDSSLKIENSTVAIGRTISGRILSCYALVCYYNG